MKTVTIPTCANPFVVIINGKKYTYPAGETVEVPDEVAEVIERHEEAKPQPEPPSTENAPSEGAGGGNVTDSQIDARVEAFWTNADLIDFTDVFDFSESIMQGGAMVEKTIGGDGFNLGLYVIDKMQRGPVKIKVALGGTTSELFVFASNFGTASQVIGFVDNEGHLLYLYILVRADNVLMFQCKEIPTSPYVPS